MRKETLFELLPEIPNKGPYRYSVILITPFGKLNSILKWCHDCFGDVVWKYDMMDIGLTDCRYKFFFKKKRDYMAFILRWQY